MIGIYTRVSTKQQDQRSQEADLKHWEQAATDPVEWFHDSFTGKSMERPGIEKLLQSVRSGQIKTIVVWRLDRLGRTARGVLELCEELQRLGVNLISLREGIDLATPAGRFMVGILASISQYEREVSAERSRAGIAAAKAAGKKWGGSKPGPRKITPQVKKRVIELHRFGQKGPAIARALKISLRSVHFVLTEARRHGPFAQNEQSACR